VQNSCIERAAFFGLLVFGAAIERRLGEQECRADQNCRAPPRLHAVMVLVQLASSNWLTSVGADRS
jgi:hypothetical protein